MAAAAESGAGTGAAIADAVRDWAPIWPLPPAKVALVVVTVVVPPLSRSLSLSRSVSPSLSHSHLVCVCVFVWLGGQYYRWLASVVDLMFFMADFIVRPPIWQFAFLEFSYLLLSSAASIASIPIANVSRTTGQYTRIGTAIHIRFAVALALAVHNHVRIHIRIRIAYSYAYSWRRRISCTQEEVENI